MSYFHPTLVSNQLVETVNFYEDYFGFVPAIEQEGYTLLQSNNDPDKRLAVFDTKHACVSDRIGPVSGLILNMAVDDVQACYDMLYMEGLDMYKGLGKDVHGRHHFVVFDPNGVLINVHERVKPELELVA